MQLGDVIAEYKTVVQPQNALVFAAGSLKPSDFKTALDNNYIVVVNLAKGTIGSVAVSIGAEH